MERPRPETRTGRGLVPPAPRNSRGAGAGGGQRRPAGALWRGFGLHQRLHTWTVPPGPVDPGFTMQVADALRARIAAGEWAVGDKLPSRARFAEEYGVGQSVAQRAMERLIIEGLLEGRAGSGTYVPRPRERLRMVRSRRRERRGGSPFRADMKEQGRAGTWESRSAARTPAPDHIAERLTIEPGDLCVVTHCEFLAVGQPVQLSESWEPTAITDGTPIVLPEMGPHAGAGVVERMRSIGVVIETAVEVPRPARASQEEANRLGIGVGDLITDIERTYYDVDALEVSTQWRRGLIGFFPLGARSPWETSVMRITPIARAAPGR